MCLIAHVPAGKKMPDDYIDSAYRGNDDGIGVMSEAGIEKFLGRKALKRAKRYIHSLQDDEIEFGVHFRYATHGDVTAHNCHPHELPNGNGWLMHNGVLQAYTARATRRDSDTAIFAQEHTDKAAVDDWKTYWGKIAQDIGSNKLLIMLPDFQFITVNGDYGVERDDIWYSQTYSLPSPYKYTGPYAGTAAYGGGGYWRPYERPVTENKLPEGTLTVVTEKDGSQETRIYPKDKGHLGPIWIGNWQRIYDQEEKRSYYRLNKKQLPRPATITERIITGGETCSPWRAWERDRDGNDPIAADAALDKELAAHLRGDSPNNCQVCFKADVPTDDDGVCDSCLLAEMEAEDKLAAGKLVEHVPGTCIECAAKAHSGNTDFCGEAFCIGIGYQMAGGS